MFTATDGEARMELKVNLNDADDVAQALGLLNMISGNTGEAPAPVPAPAPRPAAAPAPAARPAPAAAPKPAPAAAPRPAAAPAPAPRPAAAPAPAPAAAPAGGEPTPADLAAAMQAYAGAYGPKAAKAKLAEYGYTKASDIPAADVAGFMGVFVVEQA